MAPAWLAAAAPACRVERCSLDHADCFVQCTRHPSPPRWRSLAWAWGSMNSRHPSLLSPALCRGQVWSPPGKYQPLFGNIKMLRLCSVLARSKSKESSLKWWPPLPPHLTLSCINWILRSWATWRHFYQIWTSWRPGERVSGGSRVFRRTEDVSFHYIPHLGGRAYEYLWLLLFSGSGPTGPPPPAMVSQPVSTR